jgi:cobalt-zinc-cadmium efflux system membrane fusion protein
LKLSTFSSRQFVVGLTAIFIVACLTARFASSAAVSAGPIEGPSDVLRHEGAQVVIPSNSRLRQSLVIQGATERAIQIPFDLPASIEADPARLVKVLPPIAGRIVSLDKRLGESVKAGDVLFQLESSDVSQAVSDAQKAKSAMNLAQHALDRQTELGASEIAAKRDVEQAQNDLEQASSEFSRANARLVQLGAIGRGSMNGRFLTVRSPIAGRVVDLNAASGAYWNDATAAVMTVADLSSVFVTANADEGDLAGVFVGQEVNVTLNAYPGDPLVGKVRYVGEMLDPDTRRVKVRLVFDNHDGRLKPGMFARATFLGKSHRSMVVPLSAVVQSGFDSRLFVEVQPWRFEARVVQLGSKVGDEVVVAKGLNSGDRVVVRNGVLLND